MSGTSDMPATGNPEVSVTSIDGVAVLTIDRPSSRNAIGLATIGELDQALDGVLADDDARVLVIRGGGDRAFVSGGDLKELSAVRDEAGAIAMATRMRHLLDRLATFSLPVIAAINGHALGGGAEVACAADIRVAAANVEIGFTQVQLGIIPAWGGLERLTGLVGRSRAMLLVGTGRRLNAAEAERIGLVDVVAEATDFEPTWRSLAAQFAGLAPGAAVAIKKIINAAQPHHHAAAETDSVRSFARLWVAEAHWQAAAAITKRPAPSS